MGQGSYHSVGCDLVSRDSPISQKAVRGNDITLGSTNNLANIIIN
jgi:hypothetical protein